MDAHAQTKTLLTTRQAFPDRSNIATLGLTTTHELTHLFGIDHLNGQCEHPPCVMNAYYDGTDVKWSKLSVEKIVNFLDRGVRHCLMVPQSDSPDSALHLAPLPHSTITCGNGMIDEGEECDCGGRKCENNTCCDAITCKLREGAECGGGACCDLNSCKLMASGEVCRAAVNDCDLPEFCNGVNFWCPTDVYKHFGIPCSDGDFCSNGTCVSRDKQCKLLWGEDGKYATSGFPLNERGGVYGCGAIYISRVPEYVVCPYKDRICGRLHCTTKDGSKPVNNKFKKFDRMRSASDHISGAYVAIAYEFGDTVEDPGMTPFGSACGVSKNGAPKMCISGRCLELKDMEFDTLRNCSNGGILNSRGHCHCPPGFHPPDCEPGGNGGSLDSGTP